MDVCPVIGKGEENYEIIRQVRPVCKYDLGYGMYCKKYRKFFCPGMRNCATEEDYKKHFELYRKRLEDLKSK